MMTRDPEQPGSGAPLTHWSRFARNMIVFGAGVALNALLRLVILAAAARALDARDFGALDTLLIIGLTCVAIALMGVDSAVQRTVVDGEGTGHARTVYSVGLLVVAPNTVLALAVMLGLWRTGVFSDLGIDAGSLTLFLATYASGLALTAVGTTLARGLQLERHYLTLVGAVFAIRALSVAIPLAIGVRGLPQFLAFIGVGSLVAGLATVLLSRRFIGLGPDWRRVGRGMLAFGVPIGFIVIAAGLQPTLERLMVLRFDFAAWLAPYAASAFPALLLGLMSQVVNAAWAPFAINASKAGGRRSVVMTGVICIALMALMFTLLLETAERLVGLAVPIGDPRAHVFFPFIGLIVALRFLGLFGGFGLTLGRRSGTRLAVYLTGLTAGAALGYLLMPGLGLNAIPVGFALGGALAVSLEAALAQRSRPLDWPFASLALLLALMFLAAAATQAGYGCRGGEGCLPGWLAPVEDLATFAAAGWAGVMLVRAVRALRRGAGS